MPALVTNNASTTLSGGITNVATSLTVAAATGALFPTVSGNNYFYCTLAGVSGIEIVKVTARAADVFTIVRAQDGTTAKAFSNGETVELRPVAALFAADALLPDQTGNSGKYLGTNGTTAAWTTFTSTGTGSFVLATSPTFVTNLTVPTLIVTDPTIRTNADTNQLQISGGSTPTDGAQLKLYGKTNGVAPGYFTLQAAVGASSWSLVGRPDGTLQWQGNTVWRSDNFTNVSRTTYTPTVVAVAGTLTSYNASGYWWKVGDGIYYTVDITLVNIGTGSSTITFTLPQGTSNGKSFAWGRETDITGNMCQGVAQSGTNTVTVNTYNNGGFMTNSWHLIMSGFYTQ